MIEDDLELIGKMAIELGMIHHVNEVKVNRSGYNVSYPDITPQFIISIGYKCYSDLRLEAAIKLAKVDLENTLKNKHKRLTPKGSYKSNRWELLRNIEEFRDFHLDIGEFANGEPPKSLIDTIKFPCMAFTVDTSSCTETVYFVREEAAKLITLEQDTKISSNEKT